MTVLRGPADAEQYRLKVGRYHDRWYNERLPACPIADATDEVWPAWSTIKNAAGKDWSFTANKRNGHTDQRELFRIAGLEDPDERTKAFNGINKKGLKQAQGRGQIVHLWAEDFLAGRGPRIITDPVLFSLGLSRAAAEEALEYLEALSAFFDHYQPEPIATEYVAIHRDLNGHGYGCTPDVIAKVQGGTVAIDWKTRGVDSDHGAYPEEAAQIAAGACAQYMIIAEPKDSYAYTGRPVRAMVPHIDCGIVVSIKPDGCRVYPTSIDKGFEHMQAMHAFWVARLTEKAAIGKPWPPTPIDYGPVHKGRKWQISDGMLPTTAQAPSSPSDATRAAVGDTTPALVAQPDQQEEPWTVSTSTQSTPSKPSKSSKPPSKPTTQTKQPTPSTRSATTRGTASTLTAPEASTTEGTNTTDSPGTSTATPTTPSSTTPPSPSDDPTDEFAVTSHILAHAMLNWPDKVKAELAEWWPNGTPTPQQIRDGDAVWTEAQIDHLQQMCDLADAPFWESATPRTRS